MVEICLSWMHPSTLEILKEIQIIGLLPDVTERCYQVKRHLIRLASWNTDFYTTDQQSFDTPLICSQEKILRMSVMHAFLKICIFCIGNYLPMVKNWKIFLFPFALRLFFSPYGRQFYLFYVKCTLWKNPTANKPKYRNFFLIKFDIFRYLYLT